MRTVFQHSVVPSTDHVDVVVSVQGNPILVGGITVAGRFKAVYIVEWNITPEPPECVSIRAEIDSDRQQISSLIAEQNTLHPGSVAERQRILEINREIASLTSNITELEQRGSDLGCA